jgi:hypothetical protein
MAIFVALLFQVLFVFFAMIINVGLLVHDKINLQNSVDLGAIYAAQRQAEILNAIAHTNYQIRQDWKLMTWRIRVLGDMARKGHPFSGNPQGIPQPEELDTSLNQPVVCIWHGAWKEVVDAGADQNICSKANIVVPPIPKSKVVAGFLPWSKPYVDAVSDLKSQFEKDCTKGGPMNWQFAAKLYIQFKNDQARRREMIRTYVRLLTEQGNGDFKDLNLQSVLQGVEATIRKNLTRSNLARLQAGDIKIHNSLGGVEQQKWLPEIPVKVLVPYLDLIKNASGGCNGLFRWVNPGIPNAKDPDNPASHLPESYNVAKYDVQGGALKAKVWDEYDPKALKNPSLGVEKNPWYMAYVMVRVNSKSLVPFAPFSQAVELTAKAIAQPFGGRIGPWYAETWPRDTDKSVGKKIDKLVPDRAESLGGAATIDDIPNYSKYPGDRLGLKSKMALSALSKKFYEDLKKKLSYYFSYANLGTDVVGNKNRDGLAWAPGAPSQPWIREFELAAISPDLFDITYYSIDPNFWYAYLRESKIVAEDALPLWGDLGSHNPPEGLLNFGIQEQIKSYGAKFYSSWVTYNVTKWENVLTAWQQEGAVKYGFPTGRFGNCGQEDFRLTSASVPGSCLYGGRAGYSVKIVSKDYLSGQLTLGGRGQSGQLLNPPPDGF